MIGFSFTQNNIEYVIVLPSVTYTSGNKVVVGSQELEIYDSTVMASLETAVAAYQPGGSSGDYSQGYADGKAAKESAIASSQAVTANLYKSKLASEDATIAAADSTDIDGQGTIFSESYSYLKTSAEMQANYDEGYSDGSASASSRIAELELEVSGLEREIETLENTMSSFALCIESEGTSTISFNTYVGQGTITNGYYKINDGKWSTLSSSSITITQNDRLYLKADYAEGGSSSGLFNITGDYINISGSFDALLVNSSNKALKYLFKNCTLLKRCDATMPSSMYYIPSASSGDNSGAFSGMFSGCTSLINAPELPYVTLYKNCYKEMFKGCTSLTVAPSLPASVLHDNCYYSMFEGCTSLTAAPDLPAQNTTSKATCYYRMFYGCTSLSSITVSATNWSSTTAIDWVSGVSATGTFTKPTGTSIPTGTSGIPSGWTVVDV